MNATVVGETVRRHLISGAYISMILLMTFLGFGVSRFETPAAVWPSIVALVAVVLGAGLIGPEFSYGTLQLIVSKPISRSVYLLSRYAGVLAAVSISAVTAFAGEAAGRLLFGAGAVSAAPLVNVIAGAMLICALLALFGSMLRGYFNVALYFALQIGLSAAQALLGFLRVRGTGGVSAFITAHPSLETSVALIDRTLFPEMPRHIDAGLLLRMTVVAAVALLLACLAFRRREVPYGAD